MKKKRLLWLIPLVLLLAVLIWTGVFYLVIRDRSLDSRPLVLIKSPLNGEYVEVGEGVAVQAVARAGEGVQHLQIWVDDVLVTEKSVSKDEVNSPMVISTNWVPPVTGRHVVIVRAVAANGVSGQSTVFVMAEEQAAVRHVVEEGETLEVIAASYGVEEEAIVEINEAVGSGGPQAGDELEIPAAGGGSSPPFDSWGEEIEQVDTSGGIGPDSGASAGDEVPTIAEPEPGTVESLDLLRGGALFPEPTDPVQLVVEVSALQTRETYESLHCYVSLAGSTPTWVPDADYDQSTDETFASRADGTEWNVAQYLSDMNSVHITWDRNTPVPLDISCVGVTGGGLNAVELGRLLDEVPPEQWGIPQTARSSGGESQFNLAYLVTYPSKGLDETMTPPWNVRLHEGGHTLSWSYLPDVDGGPVVDGFAIFLNDQLQFTADGRTREVDIPPQWFDVPCDDTFEFTVVAFMNSYPDGDYSNPSDPAVLPGGEPGSEACPLSVTITFQVLNVGNLDNPMPVTAFFIANEQRLTLDGFNGVLVPEVDTYGNPRQELFMNERVTPPTLGLADNHGYFISSLFRATNSSFHQLVLELPFDDPENPYDSLQLGFEIYGPDNRLLCGGDLAVSAEDAREGIIGDIVNEYPVEDDPSLCVVSLSLAPIAEGASDGPLPDLEVEGITYDNTHGFHVLHLRNTGQADWVNQDLVIEATTPEGELIDRYTFRNATLEVNEHGQIGDRQFNWEPVLGACVELDPDNNVQEEIDRAIENGMLGSRGRFCPGLPDLTITNVIPLTVSDEVQLILQNRGETSAGGLIGYGALPPVDLLVEVYRTGSDAPDFSQTFEDVSLDAVDEVRLYLEIDPDVLDGYTVMVNPDRRVLERDYDNNEFTVAPSVELYLDWKSAYYDFCRAGLGAVGDNWTFNFTATIVGGDYTTPVVSWTREAENNYYSGAWFWIDEGDDAPTTEFESGWFRMNADERLVINLTANLEIPPYVDISSDPGSIVLESANNYGYATVVTEDFPVYCMAMYADTIPECEPYDVDSGHHSVGAYIHEPSLKSECYWRSYFSVFQRER